MSAKTRLPINLPRSQQEFGPLISVHIAVANTSDQPSVRFEAAVQPISLPICAYQRQAQLYAAYQQGHGNLAAKPGNSNHQHGQAFDLNTHGFDGDPIYDWLAKNGPKFGFVRTVNKEHWHWEYRPADAATLAAQGGFKLSNVKV